MHVLFTYHFFNPIRVLVSHGLTQVAAQPLLFSMRRFKESQAAPPAQVQATLREGLALWRSCVRRGAPLCHVDDIFQEGLGSILEAGLSAAVGAAVRPASECLQALAWLVWGARRGAEDEGAAERAAVRGAIPAAMVTAGVATAIAASVIGEKEARDFPL